MPGIGNLSIIEFQSLIEHFDPKYVAHWNSWKEKRESDAMASEFGRILRSWQAFRPNVMRRIKKEATHKSPCLEEVIEKAKKPLNTLEVFDYTKGNAINTENRDSIKELWNVFLELSFEGKKKTKRKGLAGIVGISKATLLLTNGKVGPAFDSQVRKKLCLCEPETSSQWIEALEMVASDIEMFQQKNKCTLIEAAPKRFQDLYAGRLYDMALGPGS